MPPPKIFLKNIFLVKKINIIIEKAQNGVSHPKNELLVKLDKYNDRKTQKWGKPTQKLLIKKGPPQKFTFSCDANV